MRRLTALALMAGLAVTACSSSDDADSADSTLAEDSRQDAVDSSEADTDSAVSVPAQTPVSSTGSADEVTVTSDPPTPGIVTEADLARFIAATEEALQGTDQAGVVMDAPEIYIALAQASCARFSAGESFDQIASGLLSELADGGSRDDNERLVGAILGAATRTLCPEHADKI